MNFVFPSAWRPCHHRWPEIDLSYDNDSQFYCAHSLDPHRHVATHFIVVFLRAFACQNCKSDRKTMLSGFEEVHAMLTHVFTPVPTTPL